MTVTPARRADVGAEAAPGSGAALQLGALGCLRENDGQFAHKAVVPPHGWRIAVVHTLQAVQKVVAFRGDRRATAAPRPIVSCVGEGQVAVVAHLDPPIAVRNIAAHDSRRIAV